MQRADMRARVQISFILSFITQFVLSYDKIAVESIKSRDVSLTCNRARSRRVIGRSINLPSRPRKEEFRKKGGRFSCLIPWETALRWMRAREHGRQFMDASSEVKLHLRLGLSALMVLSRISCLAYERLPWVIKAECDFTYCVTLGCL